MLKWYRFPRSQVWLVSGTRLLWQSGSLVVCLGEECGPTPKSQSTPRSCCCHIQALVLLEASVSNPRNFWSCWFCLGTLLYQHFSWCKSGVFTFELSSGVRLALFTWSYSSSSKSGGILLPNHQSFSCLDMPQCSGETFPNSSWKSSCQTKAAGYLKAYTNVLQPFLLLALCNTLSCVVWQ